MTRSDISRFGIQTQYAGVTFRSRLEARWACLFDIVGWPWTYEPFDLDGYIPDFLLNFSHKPVIVEVKPLLTDELVIPAKKKIDESSWSDEAIIVGSHMVHDDFDYPDIGRLRELDFWLDEPLRWETCRVFFCKECKKVSLCSSYGSYKCRINGCYDGAHYMSSVEGSFRSAWLEAGNAVQWRPVR